MDHQNMDHQNEFSDFRKEKKALYVVIWYKENITK